MQMDLISDFLSSLKNAAMRGKASVSVPYTKLLHNIATLLVGEGYLSGVEKKDNSLIATLSYTDEKPKIQDLKRVSKPSRRVYTNADDIYQVKNGHGRLVLSTPGGILTGESAREKHVGGEILFEIW